MQYHKAAHIGRERAQKAQMKLFDYAGFAMLTYTIKQDKAGFEPVGEEELAGKMTRGSESKPMPIDQGEEIYKKMVADGMQEFAGEIKTVS